MGVNGFVLYFFCINRIVPARSSGSRRASAVDFATLLTVFAPANSPSVVASSIVTVLEKHFAGFPLRYPIHNPAC